MIDPNGHPDAYPVTGPDAVRPEPVLDAQQLTRAVLALLGAVSTLLALLGITFDVDEQATQAVSAVVGLAVVAAGVILPRVRARRARALVTPLADPRAGDGTALVRERRASTPPADSSSSAQGPTIITPNQ